MNNLLLGMFVAFFGALLICGSIGYLIDEIPLNIPTQIVVGIIWGTIVAWYFGYFKRI